MDDIDLGILRLLQKNALISYKEIAASLKMSPTPIYERIKKLEKNNTITGYFALLNRSAIGNYLLVFCNVSLREYTKDSIAAFESTIRQIPRVLECFEVSGKYDYQVKVAVQNMEQYQEFLADLAALNSIADTDSVFTLREIVSRTGLPI